MPKHDEYLKNPYGFIAYEFDQNSCSTPKMRSILQIVITSETNEEDPIFIENSKTICESFVNKHLVNISDEIKTVVSQPEKMDEETKHYLDKIKNSVLLDAKLLSAFQFYRKVTDSKFEKLFHNSHNNIIVTRNNYQSNDIDFYYDECEKILKNEKWENMESVELKENFGDNNYEIAESNENLIDEIFDMISEDKK